MISVGLSPGRGRGIFAQSGIRRGEVIEEAPVVILPASEIELLDRTVLQDYYFLWGDDDEEAAILLGLCSLCNHSYTPNAVFHLNPVKLTIQFVAHRDIEPGEEVTINYNGDPDSQNAVWFEALL
jgi:SET domain-containing protein